MATVARTSVEVTADTSRLESEIRRAVSRAEGRSGVDVDVNADTSGFQGEMRQATQATDFLRTSLSRLAGLAATAFATIGVTNYISELISLSGQAELTEASLEGIYSASGFEAGEAAEAVAELNSRFSDSMLAMGVFQQGAKDLSYLGLSAQQTADTMEFLEAAIVATGGAEDDFQQATDALGRMAAQGKVTADDIDSISTAGVPIRDMLRDFKGFEEGPKGFEQLSDAITAGAIDLDDVLQAMEEHSGDIATGLVESAEQVQQTLPGMFASLQNELQNALAGAIDVDAIKPLFDSISAGLEPFVDVIGDALSGTIESLVPGIEALGSAFAGIATALAPVLPVIGEWISLLAGLLGPALEGIIPIISTLVETITQVFEQFKGPVEEAGETLQGVFLTALESLLPIIESLLPIITLIGESLLSTMLPMFEDLAGAIEELLPPLAELITALIDALMPVLEALLPAFFQLQGALQGAVIDALVALTPLLVIMIENLASVLEVVTPLIELLANLAAVIIGVLVAALNTTMGVVTDLIGVFARFGASVSSQVGKAKDIVTNFVDSVVSQFEGIESALESVIGWFENLGSAISESLSGLADVGGAISDLGDWVGLADGGVITSPTAAVVGEAGPEAVIPLSPARRGRARQVADQAGLAGILGYDRDGDRGRSGGSERPVHVTVNSNTIDPDIIERRVERALARALR